MSLKTSLALFGTTLVITWALSPGTESVTGTSVHWFLVLALVLAVSLGTVRALRGGGAFAPTAFPLWYVAASFIVPYLWNMSRGGEVGSYAREDLPLAENTLQLMLLGTLAFAIGSFAHSVQEQSSGTSAYLSRRQALTVSFGARVIALAAIALHGRDLVLGGAATRIENQGTYEATDALSVAGAILPSAAVVLMYLGARSLMRSGRVLPFIDWALVAAMVGLIGLGGDRSAAVACLLTLAAVVTMDRGGSFRALLLSLLVIVPFMLVVLSYRNEVLGSTGPDNQLDAFIGDLTPASWTTGVVAHAVPDDHPMMLGSTFLAALYRQLPSLISVPMFGPPDDTGALIFREVIGLTDSSAGVGFSIPAEGYLNFGWVGLASICYVMGLTFSLSFRYFPSLFSGRTAGTLYPVLLGSMPIMLRADALGFSKRAVYLWLIIAAVVFVARPSSGHGATAVRDGGPAPASRSIRDKSAEAPVRADQAPETRLEPAPNAGSPFTPLPDTPLRDDAGVLSTPPPPAAGSDGPALDTRGASRVG